MKFNFTFICTALNIGVALWDRAGYRLVTGFYDLCVLFFIWALMVTLYIRPIGTSRNLYWIFPFFGNAWRLSRLLVIALTWVGSALNLWMALYKCFIAITKLKNSSAKDDLMLWRVYWPWRGLVSTKGTRCHRGLPRWIVSRHSMV